MATAVYLEAFMPHRPFFQIRSIGWCLDILIWVGLDECVPPPLAPWRTAPKRDEVGYDRRKCYAIGL